jgi:CSLREA domain-containing protein
MSRFHQAWRAIVPVSVALALAAVPISLSSPLRAGTPIHITTTADTLAEGGGCSLRAAVRAANLDQAVGGCPAGSGTDTIAVPGGRYTLTIPGRDEDVSLTGDLDIASDVTIQGESATSTIIDGNRLDRVFDIARGAHVHLDRLTVYGGQSSDDQRTSIEDGGGILNRGVLLVTASVIDQNLTAASGSGGGIFNAGRLTMRDSTVSQNSTFDGRGGGIRSTGDAILKRVLVIYNEQLDFSTPGPSRDDPGSAGGVDASAYLVLSHSEVKFNHSNGMHTGGVTVTGGLISDSSIVGNGDTNCVVGGVTMVRSTMLRSVVGSNIGWCGLAAGIAAFDSEIVNSTISANVGALPVGGVYSDGSTIVSSTITDNVLHGSAEDGLYPGGLLAVGSRPTIIRGTIIAGNRSKEPGAWPTNMAWDCAGPIVSGGHNLIRVVAHCDFHRVWSDLLQVNPLLAPAADNGGPTLTYMLQQGSPAIDAWYDGSVGPGSSCPALDQRGVHRPQDGDGDGRARCDIGAVERRP